ncbi:cytochrome-c oxidase, cbb3-type subunit III [Haliea sp. AH-315-K21]|uniref:Cbb3-type cytochrome c oxidase subunit n=1 Tax=SAR86 cluster bacterium TaxID=2030880 RepID=A0A2A5CIQ6_9GAMM|nr:cytochrome-c oxidase, cbb3-type subunit III [Haliea sp. AH-315-K21]MBN4075239.1 cytochrome-c oxidase, cbb3-type subunit III [Gammaproteobacteria bacterium AH-315-E17]PCJ43764.1 MAG: cytochrome-c oxidase, cbb3-type subunit III [SAR86 cluster bacterium]
MAVMPNDFWSGWIILLTVISFIGLGWLVLSVYFLPSGENHDGEEPVWDSDLEEGSNSPPFWWFWLILSMMVISVIYLMLYPGLGSFEGAFRWSQGGQLSEHTADYNRAFADIETDILAMTYSDLAADPIAMNSASSIFSVHCSACHGAEAMGQANLFPNLKDTDWQWGGTPEQIEQTIRNGRLAVMISWQAVLMDEGVNNVAGYVASLTRDLDTDHPGKAQYDTFCIACHGPTGDGNPLLGAPRLNDDIWLYGNDIDAIEESIANGRSGQMPAFNDTLDDVQIKLLTTWLSQ